MFNCYPAWSRRTLTFLQLEDLLEMWYRETEDALRMFHNMVKDILPTDRHVEFNQDRCRLLMQMGSEMQTMQRHFECQLFDICCNIVPLEDIVCCLEKQICCSSYYVDCQKLNLYSMVEGLFIKVNNLRTQAEELAALVETQKIMYKITYILSLNEKILNGLLKKIEFTEDILLMITQQHQLFPAVPRIPRV